MAVLHILLYWNLAKESLIAVVIISLKINPGGEGEGPSVKAEVGSLVRRRGSIGGGQPRGLPLG